MMIPYLVRNLPFRQFSTNFRNFPMYSRIKLSEELYRSRAVQPPHLQDLAEISHELNLHCSDDDLKVYTKLIDAFLDRTHQRLEGLVEPTLPVKYPRTPGYRPEPKDNKCNAWYWKCDIKGAAEGKLKGKRVGVKDTLCVAGVPMINGSPLLSGYVPDIDATVVTRILDAGCNIVGKMNSEHLSVSASSFTSCTGPILNPHNPEHTCGGSSGGNGAALVNKEIDLAVASDQGGSTRIPSAFCGVVGMKPTWGLVPYTGTISIEPTVDHITAMANTVMDCALLLEVMAGYDDGRDPRQPRDVVVPEYTKQLTGDLTGRRIGIVTEGFEWCEAGIQSIVSEAALSMTKCGAVVEEISIPWHRYGRIIWGPITFDGAYKCLVQGNTTGYHWKGFYPTTLQDKISNSYRTQMRDLSEVMKMVCLLGEYISRNYGNKFYAKAQNLNMRLTEEYNKALKSYDVIVMPTVPMNPPKLPRKDASLSEIITHSMGTVKNTAPFDCTGHPSLTINAGWSGGLPVGMMINGKLWDDATVLQVAHAYEQIRDGQ